MSVDKLESMNKEIDRCASSLAFLLCGYLTATAHSYTKEKHGRQLKDCNEKIDELEEQIKDLNLELEKVRDNVRLIDKEIGESSASMSNLRENLRIRRLRQDIAATQAEIDAIDLEEAAKAKRIFEEKYNIEKEKEAQLQGSVRAETIVTPWLLKGNSTVRPYRW